MILSLLLGCSAELTVAIPRPVIQEAVEKKFPIEGGAEGIASLQLDHPTVRLPGAGRIGLDVDARATWRDVSLSELAAQGTAEASTAPDVATRTLRMLEGALSAARQAPMATGQGSGGIEGTLTYVDGSFYLGGATLAQLEIAGVDAERTEKIRGVIQPPLAAVLDNLPVYTLDADLKQKATRYVINGVTTDKDRLLVTLGLPK